jgi:hypothetical protein
MGCEVRTAARSCVSCSPRLLVPWYHGTRVRTYTYVVHVYVPWYSSTMVHVYVLEYHGIASTSLLQYQGSYGHTMVASSSCTFFLERTGRAYVWGGSTAGNGAFSGWGACERGCETAFALEKGGCCTTTAACVCNTAMLGEHCASPRDYTRVGTMVRLVVYLGTYLDHMVEDAQLTLASTHCTRVHGGW